VADEKVWRLKSRPHGAVEVSLLLLLLLLLLLFIYIYIHYVGLIFKIEIKYFVMKYILLPIYLFIFPFEQHCYSREKLVRDYFIEVVVYLLSTAGSLLQ